MIIAIPVDESKKGKVAPTFGRTTHFLFYDTKTSKRENIKRSSEGDIGVLSATLIADNKANVLLTPLCRENSRTIFNKANIKVYRTVSDSVEDNLRAFLFVIIFIDIF